MFRLIRKYCIAGVPNLTAVGSTLETVVLSNSGSCNVFTPYPNFFQEFPKMYKLVLQSCDIQLWPNFTAALKLVNLDLRQNSIASIPNVPALGFPSNNVIKHLFLNRNPLQYPLGAHVWAGFHDIREIQAVATGLTTWPDFGFATKLKKLIMSENEFTNMTDAQSFGFPVGNVLERLFLDGVDLSNMNPQLDFPQMTELRMSKCGITTWPNFTSVVKLEILYLESNAITVIPVDHGLPQSLKTLSLYNNKFGATMGELFLQDFPNLEFFNIQNCDVIDIPHLYLINNTAREILLGSTSRITTINPQVFVGYPTFNSSEAMATIYPHLTRFVFAWEDLQEIPEELFHVFPNLEILHIPGNYDKYTGRVPNFTLVGHSLETLNIYSNRGSFLTVDYTTVMRDMTALKELRMDNMLLEQFPLPVDFISRHLPSVTRLSLEDNLLTLVPDLSSLAQFPSVIFTRGKETSNYLI